MRLRLPPCTSSIGLLSLEAEGVQMVGCNAYRGVRCRRPEAFKFSTLQRCFLTPKATGCGETINDEEILCQPEADLHFVIACMQSACGN